MQSVGARLGPYEIEAPLGAGGMGEVYRARDTRLGRVVALKVLAARLGAIPGQRERFSREARAISSVEHANICPLYDVGTSGDVDFIVMQFVEGETLAERIRRGPLPPPQAVALARQIALGLEAAHERGIVHRDLKPANIQLTRDGQVKLLDFGLARILDDAAPPPEDTAVPTQQAPTAAGQVVGTAHYMSPEQARGQRVDRRTDIWAYGCVLYEMLSGRRAFDGFSLPDVMAAVVGLEPDWTRLPVGAPARLRELLVLCLRKDASERLRDIGDVRILLDAVDPAESRPPSASVTTRGRAWSALPWGVAAAALVLALARSVGEPPPPREMRFSAVTNVAGVDAQPSLSPDGRSIAYISNRGGQWDIYVGFVSGGSPVRVTNDRNLERRPRWSPDGSRLAFARLNEKGTTDVWVVPALGGAARRIIANASYPAWSPDGTTLAYVSGGSLWLSDASGANRRAATRPESQADEALPIAHSQPAFSHDGRSLAFVRRRDGPYGELAVLDLASGTARPLTQDAALVQSPAWSPDDRHVYFCSSRGGTLNVWKVSLVSGETRRITAGVGDDTEIDVSADGTRLVFSTYRANLSLAEVTLEGRSVAVLRWLTTDSARGEHVPRYAPDGRRIAYTSSHSGAEREGIWVMDADGRNPARIVEDQRVNVVAQWTPDGRELVYFSRAPGIGWQAELRRVPVGGGAPEILAARPWSPYWGEVGSDGRLLVRVSASRAELVDLRSRQVEPLPEVEATPSWSPDRRSLAYILPPQAGDDRAGVWRCTLDGKRQRVLEGWVTAIAWARSGDLLAIAGTPDLKGVLWRVGGDGRKTRILEGIPLCLLHQFDLLTLSRFDVHPDGRRIVLEAPESFEADISLIENVR